MRTDLFHYTCFTGKIPDDREYHCSGEFSSPAVQKHYIFVIDYRKPLSVNLIKINLLKGLFADRHKPLLIAFAGYSDKSLGEMNICKPQVYKLRHPESASIKSFNNRFVPVSSGLAQVNGTDYPVNFFN